MPIFIIILVIGLALYVFYKIKSVRTKAPIEKKWIQTKANMSLGAFLAAFGANLLYTSRGTVDNIVGIVFLIVGFANIFLGYRAYKLYLPYAAEEAEEQHLNT
ncbi:YtpI-like protein [Alteribacillus persepolensis]|uniref:YtpI-like protein n=1 Tax=Alteribacillus persepolensis TaxID=568899 RepID=A0A1G8BHU9_9BACI|nr:YtpI family protein [Alteribacillus persepolensis]SDH32691.1 YtpI-like protein [Alteribacillus persepolensis]